HGCNELPPRPTKHARKCALASTSFPKLTEACSCCGTLQSWTRTRPLSAWASTPARSKHACTVPAWRCGICGSRSLRGRPPDGYQRIHAGTETLEHHRLTANAHLIEHARSQRVDRQVMPDAVDGPLVHLGH